MAGAEWQVVFSSRYYIVRFVNLVGCDGFFPSLMALSSLNTWADDDGASSGTSCSIGAAPVPSALVPAGSRNIDCQQAFFIKAQCRTNETGPNRMAPHTTETPMSRSTALAPLLLLSLGAGFAAAQTPPAQPNPAAPQAAQGCAPAGGGATVGSDQPGANLSDKLARSNGVLCPPPGVDPDIRVPPPQGGVLKVVPPPGTPGGDQNTI